MDVNNSYLSSCYIEVDDYGKLKNRILSNEMEVLSKEDLQAFLSYLAKRGIVQKAAKENDSVLLEKIFAAGFDLNLIDGEFIQDLQDKPQIFRLFMKYRPQANMLALTLSFYKNNFAFREEWRGIFLELLSKSKPSDFEHFDYVKIGVLTELIKEQPSIAETIKPHALSLINENPNEALRLVKLISRSCFTIEAFKFIAMEAIPDSFKEKLFTSRQILNVSGREQDFFDALEKIWKPNWVSGDFRSALVWRGFLNEQTLEEIRLYIPLFDKLEMPSVDVKAQIVSHIESIQEKTKNCIWNVIEWMNEVALDCCLELGFNPLWQDNKGRNLFFTAIVRFFKKEWLSFDLSHRDVKGDNALEFHCRYLPINSSVLADYKIIEKLIKDLGMGIGENLPFASICKKLFPGNPFYQAILAICLNWPRKEIIVPYVTLLLLIDENNGNFKKIVSESDQIPQPVKKYIMRALPSLLESIPERNRITKEMYLSNLDHDKLIELHQSFFENPQSFQEILQSFFKVKKLHLFSMGREESTHASFVGQVMEQMGKLHHIKQSSLELPVWHKNLVESFDRVTQAIPKERMELPPGAEVSRLNRTVVIDRMQAFKFLLPGESFDHFSQECSVTEAFRALKEQFRSTFHKPLGVYQVRQLPKQLKEMESQLGNGPYYVYHYEAFPGTFQYMEDLSFESFFAARQIYLHDSARMVKLGIYPDITSLFHNANQKRKYLILLDLAAYFIKRRGSHSPDGGAGRLDRPFENKRYANARESGLTDLRDALNFYGPEELQMTREIRWLPERKTVQGQSFHQMFGLSNILLNDMLFLTDKYRQEGLLNWQDESFIEEFGNQLALGFAKVVAVYAEKPEEKAKYFSLNCGINWKLAAKQIAFWSDNSSSGYPSWVAKDALPEGLYSEKTDVVVRSEISLNFDPKIGYNTDGIQDLGPFNGPLALTEFERAMYLLYVPLLLAEPLNSETSFTINIV